jgi:hypothetical protein
VSPLQDIQRRCEAPRWFSTSNGNAVLRTAAK